jgi:hypothetical protein
MEIPNRITANPVSKKKRGKKRENLFSYGERERG